MDTQESIKDLDALLRGILARIDLVRDEVQTLEYELAFLQNAVAVAQPFTDHGDV